MIKCSKNSEEEWLLFNVVPEGLGGEAKVGAEPGRMSDLIAMSP